jgi:hypothetical protein
MNYKIVVVVLLIGLVIGCSPKNILKNPMKLFDDANRAYRHAISWSEFDVAATFLKNVAEEKKEEQIEHLNLFKVTAYEIRNLTVIEEDVRIRQVVKISYFRRDNLVVKSIADDQLWEYEPKLHTWHILSGLPKLK